MAQSGPSELPTTVVPDLPVDMTAPNGQLTGKNNEASELGAVRMGAFALVREVRVELSRNNLQLDLEPGPTDNQTLLPEAHFKLFMREARQYPLLSAEQEVALGRQVQVGLKAKEHLKIDKNSEETQAADEALIKEGDEAKRKLLLANLRLAGKEARSIYFKHPVAHEYGLMDVCQEGLMGLYEAVDKFDPEQGKPFALHAVPYIKGAIHRALENKGNVIRLPVRIHDSLRAIGKMERTGASDQEIMSTLGISQEILDRRRANRFLGEALASLDVVVQDIRSEQEFDTIEDPQKEDPGEDIYDNPVLQALRPLLSFLELGIMTKIMQGKELSDAEKRQKARLDSLFEHPAVWARLRRLYPEAQVGKDWRDSAACINDAEIFSHPNIYRRQKVIPICGGCAVRAQCSQHLIEHRPEKGRWAGGYTGDNIAKMSRRRKSGIDRR